MSINNSINDSNNNDINVIDQNKDDNKTLFPLENFDNITIDKAITFSSPVMKPEKRSRYLTFIFIINFVSNFLNGYLLSFISLFSSYLKGKFNWTNNEVIMLIIIYHFFTGIGSFFVVFTSHKSNRVGIYYSSMLLLFCMIIILPFAFTFNQLVFNIIFSMLCFTNGHIMKNCKHLLINKSTYYNRGFLFFISITGYLFGEILLCLIKSFLIKEKIENFITKGIVYLLIICLFVVIHLLSKEMFYYNTQKKEFKKQNNQEKNINQGEINEVYNKNESDDIDLIQFKNTVQDSFNKDMKEMFIHPFKLLFKNNMKKQVISIWIIQMLTGFQSFCIWNNFQMESELSSYFPTLQYLIIVKFVLSFLLIIFSWLLLYKKLSMSKYLLFIFAMTIGGLIILLFIPSNNLNFYSINVSTFSFQTFNCMSFLSYILNQLYCEETTIKQVQAIQTSIAYLIFKFSCIIQILVFEIIRQKYPQILFIKNIICVCFINILIILYNSSFATFFKRKEDIEKEIENLMNTNNYEKVMNENELNELNKL